MEWIGVHEHCRGISTDGPQGEKATIAGVLKTAEKLGFRVICDMPNTEPAMINEKVLLARLEAARESKSAVIYMVWPGLTKGPEQIAEVVSLWRKYPEVVGLKMFAGRSTGDLAIIRKEDQEIVYETLTRSGHTGALAVHCEEESLMNLELYDPQKPWTWASARPQESEIYSIKQQIELAKKTGFSGHLHICHVSCYRSVDVIIAAKKRGMKISCGITPQALLYSVEQMEKMGRVKALLLKCNPPIREGYNRMRLIEYLRAGKIDLIETDHAPHTVKDKLGSASGVMSLFLLPKLYGELRKWDFEEWQIEDLLRNNALKIFTKIQI